MLQPSFFGTGRGTKSANAVEATNTVLRVAAINKALGRIGCTDPAYRFWAGNA